LEYPPSIFLHLSCTLSRVCGGSRSSRAVGSCTAGVTCYSSSTSHWYSATGCWHRTVSLLNCDVISASNSLTAATRTARAADHVPLRHWEESYGRFETPRCVFLEGESFLTTPKRRTIVAWHSLTFYLTTIIGHFRRNSGGRMSGLHQYRKRADRKWQTTFIESNNDPLFGVQILFYLRATHSVSFFLAVNRNVCNGLTSGVVIGFVKVEKSSDRREWRVLAPRTICVAAEFFFPMPCSIKSPMCLLFLISSWF